MTDPGRGRDMAALSVKSYQLLEKIGGGSFSMVFRAKDLNTGEQVSRAALSVHAETEGFSFRLQSRC
jgi:serine/threonine protein kinase